MENTSEIGAQGIPKADAEAALRHMGDGNEAAIYVASIHPAKAAEVEERRFSAPQVLAIQCAVLLFPVQVM